MKTIIDLIYPAVKTVTRKLAAFAALTLICATGLGVPPGGGGGGSTGGGTIYFIGPWDTAQQGGTAVMRTMNSDGSNNRQLGFGLFGNPSTALHGGHRWFLYHRPIADSYYPDGTQDSNCSHSATTTTLTLTTTAPRGPAHERHRPAGEAMVHGLGSRRSEDLDQGSALVWRRRRSGRNLHRVSRVRR